MCKIYHYRWLKKIMGDERIGRHPIQGARLSQDVHSAQPNTSAATERFSGLGFFMCQSDLLLGI